MRNFINIINEAQANQRVRQRIDIIEDRLSQQFRFHPEISPAVILRLARFDPTKEKIYIRWLTRLYSNDELTGADAAYVRKVLTMFHVAKARNLIRQKDILRYPSVQQLARVLGDIDPPEQAKTESDILYNTMDYLVLIPKTHTAAIYYTKMAKGCWCTGDPRSSMMFDFQTKHGPIIIIIEKPTGKAWQYWGPKGQFIDQKHHSVDMPEFLKEHPKLEYVLQPYLRPY